MRVHSPQTSSTRRPDSAIQFFHVSNAVTYVSVLSAGMAALAMLNLASPELAGYFLVLSTVADMLDGKFARLFDRTADQKSFGVQIDSLADAVAFGAVPVFCGGVIAAREGIFVGAGGWIWGASAF